MPARPLQRQARPAVFAVCWLAALVLLTSLVGPAWANNDLGAWREQITARMMHEGASSHVIELTERYQNESRQRRIEELTRHNERQASEQRGLWTLVAGSLVLLALTALFLLRLRRSNRQLEALNTELEQSRNRLQATHDALPDLLFELGLDGRYYDCHSPYSELLVAPVDDLIGKTIQEVLPPDVVDVCMLALREANETGISVGREYALALPHGIFWFELSIARKNVPIGREPRFIGLSRDITERKHMEAALAASEREFRTLAENLPDFISRYDTQCRKTYLNPGLIELIGGDPTDSLGITPTEAMPGNPEMMEYETRLRRTVSSGQLENMDIVISQGPGAGKIHNLRFVAEREQDGRIVGALVIGRDITERKRIEAALAASECEFRTLAENMPDFVARYDSQCRKTYSNSALKEMIGEGLPSQLGKTPFESMSNSELGLHEYEEKLRRTLESGQPESMDGRVSQGRRVGEIHNLRFVAERDHDGSIIGALVFSRDISELKKKERQLESSRDMLRELAARRDSAREEERRHIAREIHDELGQMLTAQRLDIATLKFQFGTENPILADRCQHLINITDRTIQVVRNIATALRPAVIDMGIASALGWLTTEFRRRNSVNCHLLLDEEQLDLNEEQSIAVFRIVQESLTNIARYAEARQVKITLETYPDRHHLSIRDDGKGFDAERNINKSFGLIGIRERTLMLGGEAHILSAPGRGTAIEVSIPRNQPEKALS